MPTKITNNNTGHRRSQLACAPIKCTWSQKLYKYIVESTIHRFIYFYGISNSNLFKIAKKRESSKN